MGDPAAEANKRKRKRSKGGAAGTSPAAAAAAVNPLRKQQQGRQQHQKQQQAAGINGTKAAVNGLGNSHKQVRACRPSSCWGLVSLRTVCQCDIIAGCQSFVLC